MKRIGICSGILALTLLGAFVTPSLVAENQPHMRAALEHLQAAKAELEAAEHDKGGHRAKAQQLTQEAIEEVKAGISVGNRHAQRQSPNPIPVASGQANGK
jgi:hypothetical protein